MALVPPQSWVNVQGKGPEDLRLFNAKRDQESLDESLMKIVTTKSKTNPEHVPLVPRVDERPKFDGIPSGLLNWRGERSDSPLSSISDEESDDPSKSESVRRKNPVVISGVPSSLLSSCSNGPLSSASDDGRPTSKESTKALYSRNEATHIKLRSLSRQNYEEHAVVGSESEENILSSSEDDLGAHATRDKTLKSHPLSPPNHTETTIGITSESEHSGTIKSRHSTRTRRSQIVATTQISIPGHIAEKPGGFHRTKVHNRSHQNINKDSGPVRRSSRHLSSMQQQRLTGMRPSRQAEGHPKNNSSYNLSTPTVPSPRDVRATTRAAQSWSKKPSADKKQTIPTKTVRTQNKKTISKKKARLLWKQKIVGRTRKITVGSSAIPSREETPSRAMIVSGIEDEYRPRQLDIQDGTNSNNATSHLKRHHSDIVDAEMPELSSDAQTPEGEPRHKRGRICLEPTMDKTPALSLDVEPDGDPSLVASISPAFDFDMLQSDPSPDQDIPVGTTLKLGTELGPASPRIITFEHTEPYGSPMSKSSDNPIEPPALTLSPITPAINPRITTPQSSQSTLVEFSSNTEDPPWLRSIDPPSPPSSARGPGEFDTHSWRPHAKRQMFLSLPPLCFPRQTSQMDVLGRVKKPPLPMAPPVWAQSRQELCESLPYFRSYQGGVYSRGRKALGYLLDGHPAAQDLWHAEGKLIISHAGGNSAVDRDTRQTVLVNDQTSSSISCTALNNSFRCGQPIALIAGNGYNLFPYDLEHRSYVVLGHYLITRAWEEPEPSATNPRGYFVRWKFMFRWIDAQGQPWWMQKSSSVQALPPLYLPQPSISEDSGTEVTAACPTCGTRSPQIYNFGWDQEGYSASFLILREELPKYDLSRLKIRPSPPVTLEQEQESNRETTSRRFWSGFWCKYCGRLSCREHWTHWECCNCHEKLQVMHKLRSGGDATLAACRIKFQLGDNSGIKIKYQRFSMSTCDFRCRSFELPWKRGIIYLIEANPIMNIAANKIFEQYQEDAKDPTFFRRYSMKTHKLKGRMLSHYFSQNSGEAYKYVGGTDNTVPLDKYSSVKQAIDLIQERASVVLGEDPLFNEILSAAYMVDQKMEFHSDGEKDLGPVVASLSLGAPATMRFRAVPNRIKHELDQGSDANGRKTPPIALTLTLRHGDVLVMAGAEIQEFYQHAVHPLGFRIAATARFIQTEKLSEPGRASSYLP